MKKLSVIALETGREELMEGLMALGAVEITSQEDKLADDHWKELVALDGNQSDAAGYEAELSSVNQVLEALDRYGTEKKPLFSTRLPVKKEKFKQVLKEREEIQQKVDLILSLLHRMAEVNSAINKAEAGILSLLPWEGWDLPLENKGTIYTDVMIGVLPAGAQVDKLEQVLDEKTRGSILGHLNSDNEQHYISFIGLKEERELAEETLKLFGFTKVQFPDLTDTAAKNIEKYREKLSALQDEKAKLEEAIRAEEGEKDKLRYLYDSLVIARDRADIRNRLLVTGKTFYIEGWVPAIAAESLEKLLGEKGCYYQLEDPEKGEKTPVLLLNGKFSLPFESITRLYALPSSGGLDATPFFSLSFAVFFGLMFSDTAYGIILTLATYLVLKKFRLEGMTYRMIKMFFYCGIATIFWGVMFGGFFGDIITVVAKTFFHKDVVIPAIWFNPMEEPMTLLLFSFALGLVHIYIGMGLKAYLDIKDGRPFDAFCDIGLWYLLLTGGVIWLAGAMGGIGGPGLSAIGKWMTIVGAVGIILTGGRQKKGIGKIIGGFGSLYGVTGYLSDVLSYSRLLALGLATSVIASVVNTMGSLSGGGIKGMIIMVIVGIIGHSYNMAINALGSFVHSCRLEYVEFFGKFYIGGGEAFEPFAQNTKYIEIREDH
ncbi:MAG: V-type ATP synthase subunit I [Eubacteriales bacterium]|nr:V-type ATP synthase subunit I [Eubacteriales bacterium]MDD4582850.1 V-type ATP synthase subunit I [Eubacteriales bacterium]